MPRNLNWPMQLAGVCFVLVVAVTSACKDTPPPAPVGPPEPPPTEIKFPTRATHVRYMYIGDDARPVVVGERAEVPEQLGTATAVLIGERTKAPDGQLYILQPEESDERVSVARLSDEQALKQRSVAVWDATYLSLRMWEDAMVTAELADRSPRRSRGRTKGTKGNKRKAARRTIEIVSISDGAADRPAIRRSQQARSSQTANPAVGRSWRRVTIYYTPSCGWCKRAMRWMDDNGVHYTRRNVQNDLRSRAEQKGALRRAGRLSSGVPTFVIGRQRKVMQGWNEDRFIELAAR